MPRYLLRSTLLGCFAFLLLFDTASAQVDSTRYFQYKRADETVFFRARVGVNTYGGDRDINPGDELQKYIENVGFSFGTEIGYSFSERFSLSLHHISGNYPRVKDIVDDFGDPYSEPDYSPLNPSTTSTWRHHFSLIGRTHVWPNAQWTPYGQMGFNVSFGKINDQTETGIAPFAGIGLDFAVNDHFGFFLELDGIFVFDDAALDIADTHTKGTPNSPRGIDASDFDAFTFEVKKRFARNWLARELRG